MEQAAAISGTRWIGEVWGDDRQAIDVAITIDVVRQIEQVLVMTRFGWAAIMLVAAEEGCQLTAGRGLTGAGHNCAP
jgi:hypothetical protein